MRPLVTIGVLMTSEPETTVSVVKLTLLVELMIVDIKL